MCDFALKVWKKQVGEVRIKLLQPGRKFVHRESSCCWLLSVHPAGKTVGANPVIYNCFDLRDSQLSRTTAGVLLIHFEYACKLPQKKNQKIKRFTK